MSPETPEESAVWYAGHMSGERLRRGYISPANRAHPFSVWPFCPNLRGWRRETILSERLLMDSRAADRTDTRTPKTGSSE